MSRLEALDHAYRTGAMNAEQQADYRALLRELQEAQLLLEQLALPLPTVPLGG